MNLAKKTFGEIATLRNGVNYVVADQGEVVKVVGVGDFQTRAELSSFEGLSEIRLRSNLSADDELQDGDLLFVRSNGNKSFIGRCMLIRNPPQGVTFSGFTIRARLNKAQVLPEYVLLVFQGGSLNRQMTLAGGGNGNISNLNQSLLATLPLSVPSMEVQKALVRSASTWDAAIQKTERLIAAKEHRYSALSIALLFGLKRLKKYGASESKPLHWFSAPSDWNIVAIGEIAREVSSQQHSMGKLPVLSCTKHDGLVDSLGYFKKQVFSHDTSEYKLVKRGQFAYATNHIEEGSIGYQDLVPAGLVSPIYTVFETDTTRIDNGYLYKLLKTERFRQLFAANTNASVDRRGSLRWREFARICVPLPSIGEQQEITAILDAARQEIALLKLQIAAMAIQKRGLMQKLLTGQWRLPNTEISRQGET